MTEKIKNIITTEIFKNSISSIEKLFNDKSLLLKELNYHNEAINKRLEQDLSLASEILQKFIDENYHSYFEVPRFMKMTIENFKESLNHNLEILAGARRILKFINLND